MEKVIVLTTLGQSQVPVMAKLHNMEPTIESDPKMVRFKLLNDPIYTACIIEYNSAEDCDFDFVKDIRSENKKLPIYILDTGLTSTDDCIKALEAGADCYYVYPYNLRLVFAELKKCIERSKEVIYDITCSEGDILNIGQNLVFNYSMSTVSNDTTTIRLSPMATNVLRILIKANGNLVPRESILMTVWRSDEYWAAKSFGCLLVRLRKQLTKLDPNIRINTTAGRVQLIIDKSDSYV